jgi:hypothetical protein
VLRDFKKFAAQSLEERHQLARFAVSIAAADDRLALEEVRMLEKLYRYFELSETQLYSDLQGLGASPSDLPAPTNTVEPVVAAPTIPTARNIVLDPSRLARTREETARVSALLEQVFAEEVLPSKSEKPPVSMGATEFAAAGKLDARYRGIVQALCRRNTISRVELDDLAHANNVLPDGAIEAINDWAYSEFDQPLLEEDDPITINRSLLQLAKEDA